MPLATCPVRCHWTSTREPLPRRCIELRAPLDGLQGEETDIFVVKIVDQAYALQDVK